MSARILVTVAPYIWSAGQPRAHVPSWRRQINWISLASGLFYLSILQFFFSAVHTLRINMIRSYQIYGMTWPLSAVLLTIIILFTSIFKKMRQDHVERKVYSVKEQQRVQANHRQNARVLGAQKQCAPAKMWPSKFPLGLDLLAKAFWHAQKQTLPPFFCRMIEMSATTHEQRLFGARGIGTIDPSNIKAILSDQFEDFDFGLRSAQFAPLLGSGIFTQSGPAWKHSRRMLRPLFSSKRYEGFEEIRKCVEVLLDEIPDDGSLDLQPLFFRLTSKTTILLLFGKTTPSLQSKTAHPDETDFANAFNIGQEYLSYRTRIGSLYWLVNTPNFNISCKKTHSYIDNLVQQALDEFDANKTIDNISDVFINALIRQTRDRTALRDQCLNIFIAGRDTTACCITWTIRLLARHQRVLSILRTEISDSVGLGRDARMPSREDLQGMKYLALVIKETLRLYPPVPVNSRAATKTTTLPVGGGPDGRSPVLVRKGEAVAHCAYAMHRRKDIYGEDALDFRPERWNGQQLTVVGYGYLPFNAGPRTCLGQEFALLEASYTVARIVQRYPSIVVPEEEKITKLGTEKYMMTLVLLSGDGCWVKLRDTLPKGRN